MQSSPETRESVIGNWPAPTVPAGGSGSLNVRGDGGRNVRKVTSIGRPLLSGRFNGTTAQRDFRNSTSRCRSQSEITQDFPTPSLALGTRPSSRPLAPGGHAACSASWSPGRAPWLRVALGHVFEHVQGLHGRLAHLADVERGEQAHRAVAIFQCPDQGVGHIG